MRKLNENLKTNRGLSKQKFVFKLKSSRKKSLIRISTTLLNEFHKQIIEDISFYLKKLAHLRRRHSKFKNYSLITEC